METSRFRFFLTTFCLIFLSCSRVFAQSSLEKAVLDTLNSIRDTVINKAIHESVPSSIALSGVGKSGEAKAGCIIPSPFGCICHADASYSVSLNQISGANGVSITNFTGVSADVANLTVSLTIDGDVSIGDLYAQGSAKAGASACGISPSVSGDASTHASSGATIRLTSTGAFQPSGCIKLAIAGAELKLQNFHLHDSSVKINLGPIPGLQIGALVNLIMDLAPQIEDAIAKAIQSPLSDALPGIVNKEIPCINLTLSESFQESSPKSVIMGSRIRTKHHHMRGGDKDADGCKRSAGYTWCNTTQSCVRPWKTCCESLGCVKQEER